MVGPTRPAAIPPPAGPSCAFSCVRHHLTAGSLLRLLTPPAVSGDHRPQRRHLADDSADAEVGFLARGRVAVGAAVEHGRDKDGGEQQPGMEEPVPAE